MTNKEEIKLIEMSRKRMEELQKDYMRSMIESYVKSHLAGLDIRKGTKKQKKKKVKQKCRKKTKKDLTGRDFQSDIRSPCF